MKRALNFLPFALLTSSAATAYAEEPRFHLAAEGAHAAGGTQGSEFGAGGGGAATVELPVTSRLGIQAGAGAVVLAKGDAPKDPTIAPTSTGAALLGTAGLRFRGYGRERVAGPWIDANLGGAVTGDLFRPAFEAHIGWDVRVSHTSRVDLGPFVGYTQIVQPNSALRTADARILTAGIAISLGARERVREPAVPIEKPLPPPPPPEPIVEVAPPPPPELCPDGSAMPDEGCPPAVRVVENRIVLDDVIHFDFDSSRIRERSHRLVRSVAQFLATHTDIVDISIEGHADQVGSDEYNQQLSEQRALSMRELLVRFGVDRSRLRVVAHGKSHPKIATPRPELQNRRVEMFVTTLHQEPQEPQEPRAVSTGHGKSSK